MIVIFEKKSDVLVWCQGAVLTFCFTLSIFIGDQLISVCHHPSASLDESDWFCAVTDTLPPLFLQEVLYRQWRWIRRGAVEAPSPRLCGSAVDESAEER